VMVGIVPLPYFDVTCIINIRNKAKTAIEWRSWSLNLIGKGTLRAIV
jgi:hypothetical protein